MTHPSEPFGENTIEGAFLEDVGYCFENDSQVTVRANGNDEREIGMCNLELGRNQVGTKTVHGQEHPVVEMIYELTVPVELAVHDGDDVVINGFEATWTFDSVDVKRVGQNSTIVVTKHIGKSYGDTDEPERFQ